jgi:hypothetical protein
MSDVSTPTRDAEEFTQALEAVLEGNATKKDATALHPEQQARKAWADRFRTVVALAIRHHLGDMAEIADADVDLDRTRATDYVVELSHPHVACRIRCCDQRDVTIRVPGEESQARSRLREPTTSTAGRRPAGGPA